MEIRFIIIRGDCDLVKIGRIITEMCAHNSSTEI